MVTQITTPQPEGHKIIFPTYNENQKPYWRTQNISSVRLPIQADTLKKLFQCGQGGSGAGADMVYVFCGLLNNRATSSDYIASYKIMITK
jgi:hypothetical protein